MPTMSTKPVAVAAVACLALLSGCGASSATTTKAAGPVQSATQDKAHQVEQARADCMKQQGFTYIPYVEPPRKVGEAERRRSSGDYEAERQFRQKYGFGVASPLVYPGDPVGDPAADQTVQLNANPNNEILTSLSKAQRKAYFSADGKCEAEAANKVLGLKVKSRMDIAKLVDGRYQRLTNSELNGDPRLVQLAKEFGDCLQGKGYRPGPLDPISISQRGQHSFYDVLDAVARKQPPEAGMPGPPPVGKGWMTPDLTPEQARPYLDREIKAALDDLECGKEFYAVFTPKQTQIEQQTREEFPGQGH